MRERFQLTGDLHIEEFSEVVADYFRLPSCWENQNLIDEKKAELKIESGAAEAHYLMNSGLAWKKVKEEGKYPEAVKMIMESLGQLQEEDFSSHDTRAIKIFFLRRLGKIYEHWATFGEKEKPLTDLPRKEHFFMAAYYYMLGDIELGVITDYAIRISESLRGMGEFELSTKFDTAFWGTSIMSFIGKLDFQFLRQRAKTVNREKTGVATIENLRLELPDIDIN